MPTRANRFQTGLPPILLFAAVCAQASGAVGVRVVFGLNDTASVTWDGSATVRNGHLEGIDPWRFESPDAIQQNSWKASTRRVRQFGGEGLFGQTAQIPMAANGVILRMDDASEATEIDVTTAQGNFTIRLRDIPYGRSMMALGNRVIVDRIPPTTQLTNSPEEQDYPAAATDKSGTIWLAYMEFRHNPEHNRAGGLLSVQSRAWRRSDLRDEN
jgi:hypothetical protein